MKVLPLLPLLASLLLGAGCRTIETRRPLVDSAPLRVAHPARAWEVVSEDEAAGILILFEAQENADSVYFVRNLWQQDLGLIDSLGRAYRFLPHHKDPAWVGTGTVVQGVERILQAQGSCVLLEIPIPVTDEPEAPHRKAQPGPIALP